MLKNDHANYTGSLISNQTAETESKDLLIRLIQNTLKQEQQSHLEELKYVQH